MAQTSKKKNTSTKKKQNTKKRITKAEQIAKENQKRLYDEIIAIILLAFGVFFAVSMHTNLAGVVGASISNGLKGLFGLGGFILPYFLILYSIAIFAKMNRPFKGRTVILLLLIFIMLDVINAGRFIETFASSTGGSVSSVYTNGIALKNGGVVGMYLGSAIEKAFGSTGLYLISIVIIIICILLTFNTPISKAYDDAKIKKAERQKKREEKQKEREAAMQLKLAQEDFLADNSGRESKKKKNSILNLVKNDDNFGFEKESEKDYLNNIESDTLNKKDTHTDNNNFQRDVDGQFNMHIPANIEENTDDYDFDMMLTDDGFVSKDEKVIIKNKEKKAEEELFFNNGTKNKNSKYKLPPLNLLNKPTQKVSNTKDKSSLAESAKLLEDTLRSFNVDARVINVTKGSSVTRYEIQPAIGVKVASIVRLADDIALNLRARSIRIEAPIPGKAAVGIEVENEHREMVTIGEIINSKEFKQNPSKLSFALGKDIAGNPVVADLAKMPHMLIAGATGSGKSVCINTIITSLLYNTHPDEVKMVLIDPKMVELGNYNGIPHLLIPVVVDSAKAAAALNWAVAEMTDRYKKFSNNGVRNIKSYNALMKKNGQDEEVLPQIVIIIDELADLMMVASSQVEDAICRIAQLARAAGMHLIVATQRPSVDVVTGLIKATIPSRIAFMVSSQIDSRTILDMTGAEKLVGNGDMLFKPQDLDKPLRVQGAFVSDDEVHNVIEFVKAQVEEPEYNEDVVNIVEKSNITKTDDDGDELINDAIETVINAGQASVSMLQRRFRIGYNRAARIIEDLEMRGIVGPQDGSRPRQVLITKEEFENIDETVEE